MPQLDKVTFLSQFFWLCIFFFGFYIAVIKSFLPKMSRILSYRKKRLNQSHQGVTDTQQEKIKVRLSAERLLESGLKNSKDAFKLSLQRTGNWLSKYTTHTNQTKLKKTNHFYLYSLGQKSLSYNLAAQGSYQDFSNTLLIARIYRKLSKKRFLRKFFKKLRLRRSEKV